MATEILKTVRLRRAAFHPNVERDVIGLAAEATQEELDSLKGRKLIKGPWKSTRTTPVPGVTIPVTQLQPNRQQDFVAGQAAAPVDPATAHGALLISGEGTAANGEGDRELPGGFPGRMLLMAKGFNTANKVRAAADSDLLAISGVGEAMLQQIRARLADA
jgi:hypothetical protein